MYLDLSKCLSIVDVMQLCKNIIEKSLRGLDLSRGDERYKLEMGGVRHYNYKFEIQL